MKSIVNEISPENPVLSKRSPLGGKILAALWRRPQYPNLRGVASCRTVQSHSVVPNKPTICAYEVIWDFPMG